MARWGLYIHIPFCPYKCHYCDFVALPAGRRVARWQTGYARALVAEAVYWAGRMGPEPPATVFFGGGTPTMLPAQDLVDVQHALVRRLGLQAGAEVSLEANPGTVDARDLAQLRRAGFNRLSLGLQTARDDLLAAVGRHHTWDDFREAFRAARAAGFENIGVDLICGLPGQRLEDCLDTLRRVLDLEPEHVSLYALQVEEGTVLGAAVRRQALTVPDDDLVAEQLEACGRELVAAGREHYEISNFARPGRRCRHNLLYWENADYLGLGIAAHTHWRGERWKNTDRLSRYDEGVTRQDGSWVEDHEEADPVRERSETAFLGLRLLDGIDLASFAARHGLELGEAFPGVPERLVAEGLCQWGEGRLRLRPQAVAIANRAFVAFV